MIKDGISQRYLCADGTWCTDAGRALRFDTGAAGVAYLRTLQMDGTQPQLVWKAKDSRFDWVAWPRPQEK